MILSFSSSRRPESYEHRQVKQTKSYYRILLVSLWVPGLNPAYIPQYRTSNFLDIILASILFCIQIFVYQFVYDFFLLVLFSTKNFSADFFMCNFLILDFFIRDIFYSRALYICTGLKNMLPDPALYCIMYFKEVV